MIEAWSTIGRMWLFLLKVISYPHSSLVNNMKDHTKNETNSRKGISSKKTTLALEGKLSWLELVQMLQGCEFHPQSEHV